MTDKAFLDVLDFQINYITFKGCIPDCFLGYSKEQMEERAGSWEIRLRVDEMARLVELARKGLKK